MQLCRHTGCMMWPWRIAKRRIFLSSPFSLLFSFLPAPFRRISIFFCYSSVQPFSPHTFQPLACPVRDPHGLLGYIATGGLQPRDGTGLIEWWRKKYAKSAECVLAAHDNELPEKAVPIRVPGGEKRPNPRRRRAMMAKSDGRNESRRQAYNFNT